MSWFAHCGLPTAFRLRFEPTDGRLRFFGQAGYLLGEGIAMLVERREGKCFVRHEQSVSATPEMLAGYEKFKRDLKQIVEGEG